MKSVNIFSRAEIEEIVKEKLRKELNFIYEELQKLRVKLNDIERILKIRGQVLKPKGKWGRSYGY